MSIKRLFDLIITIPLLILISPIMLGIAIWVYRDSPGGILFRQQRVGKKGKLFNVLKFRTMVANAEAKGAQITVGADSRITKSGHFLRHYKLDELPQFFNILKGEMSLVGPRPEVPKYVAYYPAKTKQKVLSVRPGLTDFASIEYRDESTLLAKATDPQKEYIEHILPIKLQYCVKYVESKSVWLDLKLMLRTIVAIVR